MIKYLDIYKQYLIVEKGLALNSVNSYIRDIKEFFNFNKDGDVNGYLKYLNDNKVKSSTLNRKITSLSNYYKFLCVNKYCNSNIFYNPLSHPRQRSVHRKRSYDPFCTFQCRT